MRGNMPFSKKTSYFHYNIGTIPRYFTEKTLDIWDIHCIVTLNIPYNKPCAKLKQKLKSYKVNAIPVNY